MSNEQRIKKAVVSVLAFKGEDGSKRYMRSRLGTAFLDADGNGEISLVAVSIHPKAKIYVQDLKGRDGDSEE